MTRSGLTKGVMDGLLVEELLLDELSTACSVVDSSVDMLRAVAKGKDSRDAVRDVRHRGDEEEAKASG